MASQKKKNTNHKETPRRHQDRIRIYLKIGLGCLAVFFVLLGALKIVKPDIFIRKYRERVGEHIDAAKPEIDVQLLTVNPYSRPGTETHRK